ncbi:hypothetical protein TUN199_11351 [Pyrenophora tritici-repentis]|nr:hypothetical protein TUN199_11351 [Pyrenophora tritici-repentis]
MPSSPYFDPLCETEPHTTLYTLTVFVPERPPPPWIPAFFTRKAVRYPKNGSMYRIPPSDRNKDLDCFEHWDLEEVPTETVVIKSAWFPAEMRCAHRREAKWRGGFAKEMIARDMFIVEGCKKMSI